MNLFGFLCVGGIEVANIDRTRHHISQGLLGAYYNAPADCGNCDHVLLEPGESYSEHDKPWHDTQVWASEDFLGVHPLRMDLQTPYARSVGTKPVGGVLGRKVMRPRVLTFEGLMLASTPQGMAYGDRWLTEVLYGDRCETCSGDEALILPSCPEEDYFPGDQALRRLLGVGVTDGPTFQPFGNFPEGKVQQVSFQLTAEEPWLFSQEEVILAHTVTNAGGQKCASIDAPEWSDATAVVILEALDGPATNVVVSVTRSTGTCPGIGEACSTFTIPTLVEDGIITIDGARRQVRFTDPSAKKDVSGMRYLTLTEPVTYPVIAPCQTLCFCVTVGSGSVRTTVAKVERYL